MPTVTAPTYWQFIRTATPTLLLMLATGKLGPGQAWVAFKGSERYRKAIRDGDVCSEGNAIRRARTCAQCKSLEREQKDGGYSAGSCGPLLQPGEVLGRLVCGCLVIEIGPTGKVRPAAKTWVASESCPQEWWGPVQRVTIRET